MEFIKSTKIDFLGKRRPAMIISGLLILAGVISLVVKGGPNYSIDFVGGSEVHVRFNRPAPIDDIRKALGEVDLGSSEIKHFGAEEDILIRVEQQNTEKDITQTILTTLQNKFPELEPTLLSAESVGPKIGKELRVSGILAVLVSLVLILIYIWFRFEFVFGIGAIAALFHDVLITLGLFSLLDYEISLSVVAAFLTIVGYSLNDTIVIFDRIRENIKIKRRETLLNILNLSINQSLSRTIITSLTTLFVVLILFVNGGAVLHTFSFALLVGVIVGTYSSVFIASPVVLEWNNRQGTSQKPGKTSSKKR